MSCRKTTTQGNYAIKYQMKLNMHACNVLCVGKKTILASYKGSKLTIAFQEQLDFAVMIDSSVKKQFSDLQ